MGNVKIAYVEGYTGGKLELFRNAITEVEKKGIRLEARARFAEPGKEWFDEEFRTFLEQADVIIAHIHPTCKDYENFKQFLNSLSAKVYALGYGYEDLSKNVSIDELSIFRAYFIQSGLKNFINMILFILSRLGKYDGVIEPPEELPWSGIYHPKANKIFQAH